MNGARVAWRKSPLKRSFAMPAKTSAPAPGTAPVNNVEEIIRLEADADKLDSEASDLRWKAAELIHAELQTGKSQAQLAMEIGKSQAHVSYMARCWDYHLSYNVRPHFNTLYNSPLIRGR